MTVEQYRTLTQYQTAVEGDTRREIGGCYIGDLLSWVMGRAKADDLWITVMGNVNAVAVAVLADVSLIVLAEGAQLDGEARQKAEQQGVTVLQTSKPAYEIAKEYMGLL